MNIIHKASILQERICRHQLITEFNWWLPAKSLTNCTQGVVLCSLWLTEPLYLGILRAGDEIKTNRKKYSNYKAQFESHAYAPTTGHSFSNSFCCHLLLVFIKTPSHNLQPNISSRDKIVHHVLIQFQQLDQINTISNSTMSWILWSNSKKCEHSARERTWLAHFCKENFPVTFKEFFTISHNCTFVITHKWRITIGLRQAVQEINRAPSPNPVSFCLTIVSNSTKCSRFLRNM